MSYKKMQKKYKYLSYNIGNESSPLQYEDEVLLYNMRKRGRKRGQMEPDFFWGKVVTVRTSAGVPLKRKIYVDHLKPFIRPGVKTSTSMCRL